jgi:hypothetical protein
LIRYGFGFEIPHGERKAETDLNSKLDCAATKPLMRHFHIVLGKKIGNNVTSGGRDWPFHQPIQA